METKQDKIWSYFQNEAPELLLNSESRVKFILKQIKGTRLRTLNIGIGGGLFEKMAIERGLDVYSLDPDEKAISRLGRDLRMGERARAGFSQQIPFADGFFDVVVVSEVLEHLSDEILQKTLSEIHRVLSSGGQIIGTVPARENLTDQLTVCPHCGENFHRWGHKQSFDQYRMSNLLSQFFLVEVTIEKRFEPWSKINWKGKTLALIKLALLRLGVKGANNSLYFSAVKQ
jgi:SAM-dependent methyltransferase